MNLGRGLPQGNQENIHPKEESTAESARREERFKPRFYYPLAQAVYRERSSQPSDGKWTRRPGTPKGIPIEDISATTEDIPKDTPETGVYLPFETSADSIEGGKETAEERLIGFIAEIINGVKENVGANWRGVLEIKGINLEAVGLGEDRLGREVENSEEEIRKALKDRLAAITDDKERAEFISNLHRLLEALIEFDEQEEGNYPPRPTEKLALSNLTRRKLIELKRGFIRQLPFAEHFFSSFEEKEKEEREPTTTQPRLLLGHSKDGELYLALVDGNGKVTLTTFTEFRNCLLSAGVLVGNLDTTSRRNKEERESLQEELELWLTGVAIDVGRELGIKINPLAIDRSMRWVNMEQVIRFENSPFLIKLLLLKGKRVEEHTLKFYPKGRETKISLVGPTGEEIARITLPELKQFLRDPNRGDTSEGPFIRFPWWGDKKSQEGFIENLEGVLKREGLPVPRVEIGVPQFLERLKSWRRSEEGEVTSRQMNKPEIKVIRVEVGKPKGPGGKNTQLIFMRMGGYGKMEGVKGEGDATITTTIGELEEVLGMPLPPLQENLKGSKELDDALKIFLKNFLKEFFKEEVVIDVVF